MTGQGPIGESSTAEASFLLVSQALPRDERGICQGSQATRSLCGFGRLSTCFLNFPI